MPKLETERIDLLFAKDQIKALRDEIAPSSDLLNSEVLAFRGNAWAIIRSLDSYAQNPGGFVVVARSSDNNVIGISVGYANGSSKVGSIYSIDVLDGEAERIKEGMLTAQLGQHREEGRTQVTAYSEDPEEIRFYLKQGASLDESSGKRVWFIC